jgi:hypothetical protein
MSHRHAIAGRIGRTRSTVAVTLALVVSVLAPAAASASVTNTGWASANWAGYIVDATAPYTSVTGQWTVPSVSTSQTGFSAVWLGIGGVNEDQLIQVGTEQDAGFGQTSYSAWWEILPAPAVEIPSLRIRPGDHMSASIKKVSGNTWRITIMDLGHATFTTTRTFIGAASTAEWIVEAPMVGWHQALLAKHAPVPFSHLTADGRNPHLKISESGVLIQYHTVIAVPSAPVSTGDGFTVRRL